jgi:hypothetical protein
MINFRTAYVASLKAKTERANAFKTYRLNKNGKPAASWSTQHMTREEAEAQAAYMMRLNPGKTWIVDERPY